jgi:hypothetical protein
MTRNSKMLGGKHIVYKIPSIRFIAHKLNVLDKAILSDDNKVFDTALDEIQSALIKVKAYKRFNTQYKNKPLLGKVRRKKYNWRKHLKSNKPKVSLNKYHHDDLPFKNVIENEF